MKLVDENRDDGELSWKCILVPCPPCKTLSRKYCYFSRPVNKSSSIAEGWENWEKKEVELQSKSFCVFLYKRRRDFLLLSPFCTGGEPNHTQTHFFPSDIHNNKPSKVKGKARQVCKKTRGVELGKCKGYGRPTMRQKQVFFCTNTFTFLFTSCLQGLVERCKKQYYICVLQQQWPMYCMRINGNDIPILYT